MKVIINPEELQGLTIVSLYDKVAEKLGAELKDGETYDCRKINVSSNIQQAIFDTMKNQGAQDFEVGMMWCCYGPKVDENLIDNEVEVFDGFIS